MFCTGVGGGRVALETKLWSLEGRNEKEMILSLKGEGMDSKSSSIMVSVTTERPYYLRSLKVRIVLVAISGQRMVGLYLYPFSFYGLLKHEDRIESGTIRTGDTLGPRLQNALLQTILERWERKRKTCKKMQRY